MSIHNRPSVPVIACSDGFSSICKLPARYARELNSTRIPVVITLQIDVKSVELEPENLLVTWHGGVSDKYPDAIEVSRSFVNTIHSMCSSSLSSAEVILGASSPPYYIIHIPHNTIQVSTLELVPSTHSDWTLVNDHAELVETVLLRQTCAVQLGAFLYVALTPSAVVRLIATTMNGITNTEGNEPIVGVLSSATEVSVAPSSASTTDIKDSVVSSPLSNSIAVTKTTKKGDTNTDDSIDSSIGGALPINVEEKQQLAVIATIARDIAKNVRISSTKNTLRLLPQHLRQVHGLLDTSYLGHIMHNSSPSSKSTGVCSSPTAGLEEDLYQELLGSEYLINKMSVSSNAQNCTKLSYDSCAALVHPSLFDDLVERALMEYSVSSSSNDNVITNRRNDVIDAARKLLLRHSNDGDYALIVMNSESSFTSGINSIASVTVKLCTHLGVSPGHISIPNTLRTALGYNYNVDIGGNDFIPVSMEIIPWDLHPRLQPKALRLVPLIWSKENSYSSAPLERYNDSDTDVDVCDNKDTMQSGAKMALLRWIQSVPRGDVVLSHGQIVNLNFTHESFVQSNTSNVDYPQYHQYIIQLEITTNDKDVLIHDSSKFVYLPENSDEILLEILESVQLGSPRLMQVASASVNSDNSVHIDAPLGAIPQQPHGMGASLISAVHLMLPLLAPIAVYNRAISSFTQLGPDFQVQSNTVPPSIGVLLVGPSGCGSTTLCNHLTEMFRTNLSIMSHIEYVDCIDLLNKHHSLPLKALLNAIEGYIKRASSRAPTVLVFDGLDTLVPTTLASAERPSVGGASAGGGSYSERAAILSLHIERLLKEVQWKMHRFMENLRQTLHSTNKTANDTVSITAMNGYLRTAVCVLATARNVTDISPRIISSSLFTNPINLPLSVGPKSRLRLVNDVVKMHRCQVVDEGFNKNDSIRNHAKFRDATAGMRTADLVAIATRAVAAVATSYFTHSNNHSTSTARSSPTLQCTMDDLLNAINNDDNSNEALSKVPSWNTIGGLNNAKKEILRLFRAPVLYKKIFNQLGSRNPKAMLLYGPPGCGKTMLAKAAALKCGLRSMHVAGPQLLNKYIGASERAVRTLFEEASNSGKSTLIFFDEFEALVPKRGKDNTGVTDRVVNQFLTFLDGVEDTMGANNKKKKKIQNETRDTEIDIYGSDDGSVLDSKGFNESDSDINEDEETETPQIFVIAATSRPDLIDPAILRPGRVEAHVYLGLPDIKDREKILRVALKPLYMQDIHGDMTTNEAIIAVCKDARSTLFNNSDLHAIASTAFLLATNEYISRNDNNTDKEYTKVFVTGRHIWLSFEQTRPSLSVKDNQFYKNIHETFRNGSTKEGTLNQKDHHNFESLQTEESLNTSNNDNIDGVSLFSSPTRNKLGTHSPPRDSATSSDCSMTPTQVSPLRPYVPSFHGLRGAPFLMGMPANTNNTTTPTTAIRESTVRDLPTAFAEGHLPDEFQTSSASHANPSHLQQRTTFM